MADVLLALRVELEQVLIVGGLLFAIGLYIALAFHVRLEISSDHEIIVMIQLVQQGSEARSIAF